MKKKNIVIGVLIGLVIVILIVTGLIKSANKKRAEEEAARLEALAQQAAIEFVIPVAEAYGIFDLELDHMSEGSISSYAYFTSETFGKMSDEEKLDFLVGFDEASHLNDNIFPAGNHSGNYLDIYMLSDGKEYSTFTSQGESWLMEDGNQIFVQSTSFAKGVSDRLRGDSDNKSSGGTKSCKKCGASGVNLTAGGYCKTCVDVYYTDYYVDWDGQISADRPY